MAGVVESLKGAGPLGIAIFIMALVGNLFNWIAFTTASWARAFAIPAGSARDVYTGYGLWRICASGSGTGSGDGLVTSCQMLDGTNIGE